MPVTRTPPPFAPVSFEVYSFRGNLLAAHEGEAAAERTLATTYDSKLIVAVSAEGRRAIVIQRKEMQA